MLSEQQQRIMGYFIEEAKDHLNTIEQGLINLQATIEDSEMVHEVFRAAHSVKGGAAMLGLSSIQHAAHRLEDYFKVLKECRSVKTTHKLETLFLRVFDTLQELIEQLQGPFGLTEDKSTELMAAVEPVFAELSQSLSVLVSQCGATLPEDVELVVPAPAAVPAPKPQPIVAQEESAIQLVFQSDVPALLRQMLQLFKQPDNANTRQQLQDLCGQLAQPGEQLEIPGWCNLIEAVKQSIASIENSYRTLAPIVIKEVKQAQELVLAGRSIEIAPSHALMNLLPQTEAQDELETEADFSSWFNSDADASLPTSSAQLQQEPEEFSLLLGNAATAGQPEVDYFELENVPLELASLSGDRFSSDSLAELPDGEDAADFILLDLEESEATFEQAGPKVGDAELNSLADLFEADLDGDSSPAEMQWTDIFDESFDSPLSEMDTALELGDDSDEPSEVHLQFDPSPEQAFTDSDGNDLFTLLEAEPLDAEPLEAEPLEAEQSSEAESALFAMPDLEAELSDDETPESWYFPPDFVLEADSLPEVEFNLTFDEEGAFTENGSPTEAELDRILPGFAELPDFPGEDEVISLDLGEPLDYPEFISPDEGDAPAEVLTGFLEEDTPPELLLQPEELPLDADVATGLWVDTPDEVFSLEQEESGLDLGGANLSAAELFEPAAEQTNPEIEAIDSASSFNLFDSDLEPASSNNLFDSEFDSDLEPASSNDAAAENFDDLEALLAGDSELSSDWDLAGELGEASIEFTLPFAENFEIENFEIDRDEAGSESPNGLSAAELEDREFAVSEVAASEVAISGFGEDEFADLEAMLNEAPDCSIPITISSQETAEDEFADLEALLQDVPLTTPPEIDSVPTTGLPAAQPVAEDEFGDLEALIKDVDQVLGVGSSPSRKVSGVTNRRPNRRNPLNDQMMRVSVKHLDNLNNLVGEMVVNRNSLEQAQERLRQFLDNLLYQVQQLSDVGQRMHDLYERSLLERSLLASRRGGYSNIGVGSASQTSHAIGVSFDALEIDQFTAFHTLSQEMIELIVRVREGASDIDFVVDESDQVTRNFRQITTQLQEGLTRSRMVPFAQTADRLPRGVRDNSLKYGKQAELVIEGRETLIDKMIVDQLSDPMTHLVNNAIAHGIETPEERIAAGKSPTGRITIRAFHQGNQTIISVSDDGAGINPERVKAKALQRGLITPAEARELSRLDVYDLLFHHGFSTVDQADDLRGRGVGLDVVRNNLSEIRGSISIDSAVGKGTTFTIRLPLTLSISKALCCISNRARIAFPMDGVEDMFDVPSDRLQTDEEGRSYIHWRDMILPLQPLSELLRYGRILGRGSVYGGNQEDDVISIVVLRSAGNFLALQVDQVLGEQEIVIKQLEGPVPKPIGVAGATVLGDGRIMPIADVLELIDLWQGRIRREPGTNLWEREQEPILEESTKAEPTVLIVDDSITVRELLSMTFNKVGYRVEQARDGQEAWEKLRAGLPCNLIFCDIEMPRMDGLELLSRMQKDPNLCELPIAMLTSRGADRHKQMAIQLGAKGYFTKPYLEEVLLDAAQRMLRGEVLVNGTPTSTIN